MNSNEFKKMFEKSIGFKRNEFHPLVWINGEPKIGENVYIGGLSEINANGTIVEIGDNCDIASFVAINAVDSHKKCIGIWYVAHTTFSSNEYFMNLVKRSVCAIGCVLLRLQWFKITQYAP